MVRVRWSMIYGEQVVLNEDTKRTERGYQEIPKIYIGYRERKLQHHSIIQI
jgi:hypothetical protein